jgi:hypothetical protein
MQQIEFCQSSFEGDPRHVIQVENLKNQFHPPVMLLSQYLERVR